MDEPWTVVVMSRCRVGQIATNYRFITLRVANDQFAQIFYTISELFVARGDWFQGYVVGVAL